MIGCQSFIYLLPGQQKLNILNMATTKDSSALKILSCVVLNCEAAAQLIRRTESAEKSQSLIYDWDFTALTV